MTLTSFDGGWNARIGFNSDISTAAPTTANVALDAAEEAMIWLGHIATSDQGSHTINTSGSSALSWRTSSVTFANAGTTVKVGLGAVDMANGPPGRAVNVANVITMDVSKSIVGGGGGITTNTWHTHVPDAGTKTIAHGDLVAFSVQMTARAGVDSILISGVQGINNLALPCATSYTGAAYAASTILPNCIITFSDGARGFFYSSEVLSTINTATWNSGSAAAEYGQLFKIPAPLRVYGLYGVIAASANLDIVLYSDPLGTPVAERTVTIDLNTVSVSAGRRFTVLFSSPYDTTADQLVAAVFKPGGSNISAYRKTLGNAADRITDVWGVDGHAVSRVTGAFTDLNSGLDHFYIGLLVGGLDNGVGGGGGVATPLFGGGVI